MSYQVKHFAADFPVDYFNDSFTTQEVYERNLSELDDAATSVTLQYNIDLKNQISKSFLQIHELSDNQLNSFIGLVHQIEIIESICDCQIKEVFANASVENELILYRRTENGVCLLSVDSDGDILFNYTGYKKGFETHRYKFGEIDFEHILYNFLSR